MNRTKLPGIVFLIITSLILSSCGGFFDEELVLLPIEKYPAYDKSDTFIYKSIVTEDLDTFVVTDFIMDTVSTGSTLLQVTGAIFTEFEADSLGEDFFYISNEPTGSFFSWGYPNSFYFYDGQQSMDTILQSYEYEGLVSAVSLDEFPEFGALSMLYFDWEYGLVKYDFNDGDSYELFSRPE